MNDVVNDIVTAEAHKLISTQNVFLFLDQHICATGRFHLWSVSWCHLPTLHNVQLLALHSSSHIDMPVRDPVDNCF